MKTLILLLILTLCVCVAQAATTPSGRTYQMITGAQANSDPVIAGVVGIMGSVQSCSPTYIQIEAASDSQTLRCTWYWSVKLNKGDMVTVVGTMLMPGVLNTQEVIMDLTR